MNGDAYFVYVLKLENGGHYVGSTKNLFKRIKNHFNVGGAIATKESKPIAIIEVLLINDHKIEFDYAHLILEISVAIRYSKEYGANMVRGAKHGKGWMDFPTPSGERAIQRVNRFMSSESFSSTQSYPSRELCANERVQPSLNETKY